MTPKEFNTYFEQYTKMFKIKQERSDRRSARICSILANINRDTKKRKKPFSEDDFMPTEKSKEKKKMSVNHMAEVLKAITLAYGGTTEG